MTDHERFRRRGHPQLSSHALAALQEFYAEQRQRADSGAHDKYDLGVIEENWQLSQFWYNQETALRLAEEAVAAAGDGGRIACVSAPSVYRTLRRLHRARCSACLFEHDRRFAGLGEEFVFYDYRRPLDFPPGVEAHSFDLVIADPLPVPGVSPQNGPNHPVPDPGQDPAVHRCRHGGRGSKAPWGEDVQIHSRTHANLGKRVSLLRELCFWAGPRTVSAWSPGCSQGPGCHSLSVLLVD